MTTCRSMSLLILLLPMHAWSVSAFSARRHAVIISRPTTIATRFPTQLFAASTTTGNKNNNPSDSTIDVLCIGDALFDCIANDNARGLSVTEMADDWTAFPGGAPANVAAALCKLGTTSTFCGCLGTDADGDVLVSLLHDDVGVDTSMVQRNPAVPTRRVMVTRTLEGDRAFGGFSNGLPADAFSDCFLDAKKLMASSNSNNRRIVQQAKWVACSTLSLAFEASAQAVRALVKEALSGNNNSSDNSNDRCRLLVDVNWRPVFWKDDQLVATARQEIMDFVQQADVVKLTDEEAEWLLDDISAAEALSHPEKVHASFPNAFAVLITAGEKGASYSINQFTGKIEPFVVNVTETTGAGDAFTAGFLHGMLQNGEPTSDEEARQMISFAAAVGALTCTKKGAIAAQPTFHEVESFLIHGEKVWK